MKAWLKSICPPSIWKGLSAIRQRWFTQYAREAYSQEGEDLILDRLLHTKTTGFYVDIGAHHPKRFSNTYLLYQRGWRGLNVDAAPGSMAPFRRLRPRDINVEAAIGLRAEKLTFHIFDEPALNTFDKELAAQRNNVASRILREVPITTVTLANLLDQYLPPGTNIDVLSIDVEGFDQIVLQSNDWNRYKPQYILVECLGALTPEQTSSEPTYTLLSQHGYQPIAKTVNTTIFLNCVTS